MITKSGFLVQKNIQSSHKFKVSSSRLQYRDQASRQWIIFPLFYEFAKYVFSTSAMVKIFFLGSAVQWTVFIDTFCLPYSLCRLPSSALMRKWPGSHNAVVRWHELSKRLDVQSSLFSSNCKLLGLGKQFWQIHFWAFGVSLPNLLAPILVLWVPCPCVPIISHYFYKKMDWD